MADSSNVWLMRLAELEKLWSEGLAISQIGEALGVSRTQLQVRRIDRSSCSHRSMLEGGQIETVEVAPPSRDLPLRMELRQLEWSRSKCWPTGDPRR